MASKRIIIVSSAIITLAIVLRRIRKKMESQITCWIKPWPSPDIRHRFGAYHALLKEPEEDEDPYLFQQSIQQITSLAMMNLHVTFRSLRLPQSCGKRSTPSGEEDYPKRFKNILRMGPTPMTCWIELYLSSSIKILSCGHLFSWCKAITDSALFRFR